MDSDIATVLTDQIPYDPQAQSGAFILFRAEERLENLSDHGT
jgi:hypothetical protein